MVRDAALRLVRGIDADAEERGVRVVEQVAARLRCRDRGARMRIRGAAEEAEHQVPPGRRTEDVARIGDRPLDEHRRGIAGEDQDGIRHTQPHSARRERTTASSTSLPRLESADIAPDERQI